MSDPSKTVRLERRLTRRMIQVQAVVLLLFFGVIAFPLAVYPALRYLGPARPLDPANTAAFAEALRRAPDGTIRVEMTPRLAELVKERPEAWFYATTETGNSASLGDIPRFYDGMLPSLWAFQAANIRPADSEFSELQLDRHHSVLGDVMVASGSGRRIGVASILGTAWALSSIGILLLLSAAAALVIPRVIRRELRGIKHAAERANLIDINSRGTRLPTENVPEEVRALVDAVNDALQRLDQSYEQRERFLADSAHELRTPIAILQTRLETAEPFPERSRLLVDVARLSSLADQLLDLQRMDHGDGSMQPIDLVGLAEAVVADLAPLAINAGYEIALNAPPQKVMVKGDAGSLARALANLIQNAIAHGDHDGQIGVEVTAAGTLSVSDDGPGIASADRTRIFEPFYRIRPQAKGAGLGLNLVASIVQRHRGAISVGESDSGGARFDVTLPLESIAAGDGARDVASRRPA
jgi:signal transduction histidine kinase